MGDSKSPFNGATEEPSADLEIESVLTTAADVESAGRSCLAIVALAVIILILLFIWIVVRSTGG